MMFLIVFRLVISTGHQMVDSYRIVATIVYGSCQFRNEANLKFGVGSLECRVPSCGGTKHLLLILHSSLLGQEGSIWD